MALNLRLLAVALLVASATAFTAPALSSSSFAPKAAFATRPGAFAATPVARRAAVPALRMQTEDEKAKAAGVACAVAGLLFSQFSVLVAVVAGGAAVYAAKLPEEGDKGVSDTAKQVALLIGTYALKAFDVVKKKDAEEGWSAKVTDQLKDTIDKAKGNIKQG